MKSVLLAIFAATLFFGCSTDTSSNVRSVYMLLDPSQEELKHKEKLQETFAYIINDLSPGDSLAIHTPSEILAIDFSLDASQAYIQKRDFRRKVLSYIEAISPKLEAKVSPTLEKAKAYLDGKMASRKSIIYCNTQKSIPLKADNLEGYTISMLNLSDTQEDLTEFKTKIEMANGRFLVASSVTELQDALDYR